MPHSQKPTKAFAEYSYEISPDWWLDHYIYFLKAKHRRKVLESCQAVAAQQG